MLYDFHTHTTLSDGVLSPIELIRRCIVNGYSALGITDHTSASTMGRLIREVERDCVLARKHWGFEAYTGVELTHMPATSISELAAQARRLGAAFVVVHGQSPVEPVEPGTNLAAVACADVDILAHPGEITEEEAHLAAEHDVYLEITARDGHSLSNGHVARLALSGGAKLVLNSDTHLPEQILTEEFARRVAVGAGLEGQDLTDALTTTAEELLAKIRKRLD